MKIKQNSERPIWMLREPSPTHIITKHHTRRNLAPCKTCTRTPRVRQTTRGIATAKPCDHNRETTSRASALERFVENSSHAYGDLAADTRVPNTHLSFSWSSVPGAGCTMNCNDDIRRNPNETARRRASTQKFGRTPHRLRRYCG